jgi:hypothetical protein
MLGGKFAPWRPGAAKNLVSKLPEDLAPDAIFFDGFELVSRQRNSPHLKLSDILHHVTCQAFFVFSTFKISWQAM